VVQPPDTSGTNTGTNFYNKMEGLQYIGFRGAKSLEISTVANTCFARVICLSMYVYDPRQFSIKPLLPRMKRARRSAHE
jgi:hypothetical protein